MLDNRYQSLLILEMHFGINPEGRVGYGCRCVRARTLAGYFRLWALITIWTLVFQPAAWCQESETNPPAEKPPAESSSPNSTTVLPTVGPPEVEPASAAGNPATPTAAPIGGTSQLGAAPPGPSLFEPGQALLNWGFLHLSAYVGYQVSYGNGLQSAPGQISDTLINTVSPGVSLRLGDHWTLSYSPTLIYYSNTNFQNAVDHGFSLQGSVSYDDWNFGLSQGYAISSEPLIQTAGQTSQQTLSTALTASYQMSSRVSLYLGANQAFRFVDQSQSAAAGQLTDTREWSGTVGLGYRWAPRFSTGLIAGYTYDTVTGSPDMTSEQLQGRVSWQVGNRLGIQLSGGVDYRQFQGSGVPNLLSPIYTVSASYHLFEPTSLAFSAAGGVSPSYFAGEASQSFTLSSSLNQRLLHRIYLSVTGGYSPTTYHATTATVATVPGNYETVSVNVAISTAIFKRASTSIFYQETFVSTSGSNASAGLFNYTTRTVGLSLRYQF
jgi:hypothetical protein